jgi:hypothetical protein
MARRRWLVLALLVTGLGATAAHADAPRTRNVVLIVLDGLRWQEVFGGAEEALLNADPGGSWASEDSLRKAYWRPEPAERRAALFPFLWGYLATHGQLIGNQHAGSIAKVTNGLAFSYPGYNEMLTGAPDARINSNEYGPNPNRSVFEWLNGEPGFAGRVAAFATWHAFKDIFNVARSHLPVQAGRELPFLADLSPAHASLLTELYRTTTELDEGDIWDAFLQPTVLAYVTKHQPRVLFVGFGETDDWAHSGRYDLLLASAHAADGYIEALWKTMQALPAYRDSTTFIITCDHGRGSGPQDWKEHGVEQAGSENVWLAILGPDTPATGERRGGPGATTAQIAATLAAFVQKDYRKAEPRAADVLAGVGAGR